ncbi:PadR family transcriptional regulator [Enterococcus sp. BWM-S5]|uniref:PadR family transcriptional regulator n=1 Tax=Enterococcus larvae TaxID=2794352 RepID=A0ABS4CNP0_9ENTE|nr:PadR family transcriptional regulator [Enterococcus larvae]MBP1048201.1 PadR family transcriptional regulator [Enterococcus larvae]
MDTIILGILLLKESTVYELRNAIKTNFTSMSSSSTGSIQAAIKKLLAGDMVTYQELVENSVNKKIYSITDKGKEYFLEKIEHPMKYKEKNMELSKFFFMGFLPAEKRIPLIKSYIQELEKEKAALEHIHTKNYVERQGVEEYKSYLKESNRQDDFTPFSFNRSLEELITDIADYQYSTLELGLKKIDFEITWFKDQLNKATSQNKQ